MRRTLAVFACAFGLLAMPGSPIGLASSATAASSPQVDLISIGKSPRSTLRMAVTDGAETQATMVMSQSITQSMGGKQINAVEPPPTAMQMHARASAPSPTGNTPVSYGYSNITVINDGSLTEAQLAQYQAALAPLESLAGTGTLTPRNQFLDSKVSGIEQLDPSVAQVLSQLSDQLSTLTAPFPREAVGIGARWRTTSPLRLNGIDVEQTTQYLLRAREGSQVVFDVKVTQKAPRQSVELPGVPAGTKVEVVGWKMSGAGSVTLSLVQPVLPLASEMRVSGTQLLEVRAEGERGTLVQKITTDVKLSP